MPSIGPSLPPHLTKRKRDDNDDDDNRSASSASSSPGPQLPSAPRPASSPDNAPEKRRRVVAGPAPPPAPLDEMPATAPNADENGESDESDDSSDDGFGPALPTAADVPRVNAAKNDDDEWGAVRPQPGDGEREKKTQRDEWMMVPPKQDDLAARLDPTKLRARGFQTGKGARAPNHGGGGDLGMWLETPEQKRKRLENEVMGKGSSSGAGGASGERDARRKKDEETARRLKKHEEKRKGESLYDKHREKVGEKEDDDPSKRAFDYQKDMASGMRIDGTKRKEMIRKAGDFSSKFSGGSYL
ncbi:hypothetical protein BK809_0007472 [Diplodia seriata]|uniref:DUF3752 domain-containing protein n=1 Tax=Diplodia seriata TaxID=420778 RepID=A0A1S8BIU2_9PEZI|nr:hypothetical protein BK809_0007472 [Diplodia seriata]